LLVWLASAGFLLGPAQLAIAGNEPLVPRYPADLASKVVPMLERVDAAARQQGLAGWPDLPSDSVMKGSGIVLSSDALANGVWRNPRVSWFFNRGSGSWSALVLMRVPGRVHPEDRGDEAYTLVWLRDAFGVPRLVRVLETYGAVRPQRADDEWFWSESDILGGCAATETDLDVGGSATPSAIAFLSPDRPCFLYVGLPESDSGVTLAYDPRLGFATLTR
jgi:hypothetical protein